MRAATASVCSASLVVWARHPGPSDPSLRWQRRPRPPRIRRCGGLAPRIRRCGDNSGPRSRSRHRGGNSAPALGVGTVAARGSGALGVDIVAVPGSGALGSWHSFGSGSFGLDTAVALTPLVRPLGSPALTPLVRSLGSSPSASCPAPLFRRFRLAVRGIAPCDARCWLPDNWASMSLLAVLLKFARYA